MPRERVSERPLELVSITVCPECGRPVNPRTQREYDAFESLGVHLGTCWSAVKRRAAQSTRPLLTRGSDD